MSTTCVKQLQEIQNHGGQLMDGYCLPYSLAYQTLGLDTTADTDKCTFSLKCALSDGLDQDCQCKNATACRKLVNNSCADSYLFYPDQAHSFLLMFIWYIHVNVIGQIRNLTDLCIKDE